MNTLHLTYAVEVERCGSITQAAENLYMAQPNLSKAIKELEETMGFAIFSRTSRGVLPTARGKEFLIYARAILAEVQKMEALSAAESDHSQRFCMSAPADPCISDCLAALLDSLDQAHPLDFRIRHLDPRQAVAAVAEGQLSLAVSRLASDPSETLKGAHLSWETLRDYDALAMMSTHHPLAAAEGITAKDLAAYPLLFRNGIQTDDRGLGLKLLSHTTAYLWSPPESPQALKQLGLVQRVCPGAPHQWEVLIRPKDQAPTALEQRFITLLKERCAALAQDRS